MTLLQIGLGCTMAISFLWSGSENESVGKRMLLIFIASVTFIIATFLIN